MEFKTNEAIYLQIADYMCEHILLGRWLPDEKVPSVRELAASLEVNPNTVMRSYEQLQQLEVVYNKRGMGFFVEKDAVSRIKKDQKSRFLQQELPGFFRRLYLLDIGLDEITEKYTEYRNQNNSK